MMSPFSDLDFLDTLPLGTDASMSGGAPSSFSNDFGMDFGMGWDGSLPGQGYGEDSGNVDLFEGFFFGGNSG